MKTKQTAQPSLQQGKRVYSIIPDSHRLPPPTGWLPEYPDDVNEPGDPFTDKQLDQMESDARYNEYSIEDEDAVTIICQLKDAQRELKRCQSQLRVCNAKLAKLAKKAK